MGSGMEAAVIGDTRDRTGERPHWDPGRQRLTWSDNRTNSVRELLPDSTTGWRNGASRPRQRRVGAAIPRSGGGFAIVGGVEVWFLDEDGGETRFVELDLDPAQLQLNDAKCD